MNVRPSGAQRLELFSPIPKHVMGDDRLTAGHWRLTAVIAWHDRFGANGRGCYAKHEVLAEEANISYENVSHFAADLAAWGIITSEHFSLDRRRRIYRLIYKEKKGIGVELSNEYGTPDERTKKSAKVAEPNIFQPEIGVGEKQEVADSKQESNPQYIELSSSNISCETFIGRNTNLPLEKHVKRNPSTKWENLVPFKTAGST